MFTQNTAKDLHVIAALDNTPLTQRTDALLIGAGGDVSVITSKGNTVTFVGVPTGTILPIAVTNVNFTGTTAAKIFGLKA